MSKRETSLRWLRLGLVITVGVFGLTGCSGQKESLTRDGSKVLTWELAKAEVQADELAIIASLGSANVSLREQRPTGVLLSCKGENRYGWAGGAWVTVFDPDSVTDLLEKLRDEWDSKDDYTARLDYGLTKQPTVEIRHVQGDGVFVGTHLKGTELSTNSFSRCFELPDGTWPGGSF